MLNMALLANIIKELNCATKNTQKQCRNLIRPSYMCLVLKRIHVK